MKIHSVFARNFMKYSVLEITSVPATGVIGIFGENESGKSTIGDAISFGLFGLTPRGCDGYANPPVRWGCADCEIRLTFSAVSENYTVERFASKSAPPRGKIIDSEGRTAVSGWDETTDFVERVMGLGFKGFRHTAMLCQKELDIIRTRADERRQVVDSLLGTGTIDRAMALAAERNAFLSKKGNELTSALNRIRESVEAVDAELVSEPEYASRINSLEGRLAEVEADSAKRKARVDSIEEALEIRDRYLQVNDRLSEQRAALSELESDSASVRTTFRELSADAFEVAGNEPERTMAHAESYIEKKAAGLAVTKEKLRGLTRARDTGVEIEALEKLLRVREDSLVIVEEQIAEGRRYQAEIEYCEGCLKTFRETRESRAMERRKAVEDLVADGADACRALADGAMTVAKRIASVSVRQDALKGDLEKVEKEICESGEKELGVSRLRELNASIHKYHGISLVSSMLMILTLVGSLIIGLRESGPWWVLLAVPALLLVVTFRASETKKKELRNKENLSTKIREAEKIWRTRISGIQAETTAIDSEASALAETAAFIDFIDISGPVALEESLQKIASALTFFAAAPTGCRPFDGGILGKEFHEAVDALLSRCRSLGVENAAAWDSVADSKPPRDEAEKERESSMAARLDAMAGKFADPAALLSSAGTLIKEISQTRERIEELSERMEPYNAVDLTQAEAETEEQIESMEQVLAQMKESFLSMRHHYGKIQETSRKAAEVRGRAEFFLSKRNSISAEWESRGITNQEGLALTRIDLTDVRDLHSQSEEERLRLVREISRLRGETARFANARSRRASFSGNAAEAEAGLAEVQMELRALPEVISGFEETRECLESALMERVATAAGEILGKITGERYREIRLDRDMGVTIFSPEKKDFVPAASLSGGTEDQALLALRIGFARVLLPWGGAGFLFLDEPLASFDERRRGSFIEFVKYLESSFGQVFLISHLRGLEKYMDTHVFLSRNADTVSPGPLAP